MSNFKLHNNVNYNKFECGNIHFTNDLDISISNSEFLENISKSDGGAM